MAKANVPTADEVAKKWAEVTPQRQGYFESGVKGAGPLWEAKTLEAAANYKQSVSASNIQQLFSGGVKKAGAQKYTDMATSKGPSRFSDGVAKGQSYYKSGVEPMLAAIASVEMSARGPRNSATNYNRVKEIGNALALKRLALRGAGV